MKKQRPNMLMRNTYSLLLVVSVLSNIDAWLSPTVLKTPSFFQSRSKQQDSITLHTHTASSWSPTDMSKDEHDATQSNMEELTSPRLHPFLDAEKVAKIVEAPAEGISTMLKKIQRPDKKKEHIVVLGTGWGGSSFLKKIDASNLYDVTIISPRNHFEFTPMLAGASVGTVEFRSICEPIREVNRHAKFLEAHAIEVDPKTKTITCQSEVCDGNSCETETFDIEYDKLIVTVGSKANTFGIKGVEEYCNFLREVDDAKRIRSAIVNCFESANLPGYTDKEREQMLTFAIIGGGPAGIEFAAELRDFIEQDGPRYYPDLLKFVRIKIIEASGTVLAPFDASLQQEAIRKMNREVSVKDPKVQALLPKDFHIVELMLNAAVQEVSETVIKLKDNTEVPYGLAVWAAGNGPRPLTLKLIETLGSEQANEQKVARGRLAVDPWMRVLGSDGSILSFGDCAFITTQSLPATAQVAMQQGEYLATLLNKKYDFSPQRVTTENGDAILPPPKRQTKSTPTPTKQSNVTAMHAGKGHYNSDDAKAFQYLDQGILAYTGDGSALVQVKPTPNALPLKGKGKIGNAIWKTVYLYKQISNRNRVMVLHDWVQRRLFGRDVTRL